MPAGVLSAHRAIKPSTGPPADFGSPSYSWWAHPGYFFSDDAHTTPQNTNGGAIANWLDRVGGIYLAQATSGHRPTLNTNALNGKYGVAFDGIDELPRYLFVWLVMIGAASAMYRSEHTVLDYFVNLLPQRGRALVSAFVNIVGIIFFAYLIKLSWVLVPNAQYQNSPGLELPLGYVFAAIPVGAALIIIPMLRNVINAVSTIWPRRS